MDNTLELNQEQTTARKIPIARDIEFKFHNKVSEYILPIHYVKNNPILTHYVNAMHVLFPDGERFFIDAVKYYEDRIKDPELKKAVKKFVFQESIHNREHQQVWDHLEKQGLKPMWLINKYRKYFWAKSRAKDYPEKKKEQMAANFIAATSAGEHFTVMMAITLLSEKFFTKEGEMKNVDQEIVNLMVWHAIEEIEHKDVAFDVMKEVGISNKIKNRAYRILTRSIALNFIIVTCYFYWHDKKKRWRDFPRHFREAKKYIFWTMGIIRDVNSAWDAKTLWKSYLAEDFHPNHDKNLEELYNTMIEKSKVWMDEKMVKA